VVELPIANPGFEDISGQQPFNEFTFGPPNGWSLYDPDNITQGGAGPTYYLGTLTPFEEDPVNAPGVYVNFPGGAAEGQRVAIAFNFAGSGGQGEYGIEQELTGIPLEADTTYTLRVEIGNIASGTAMSGEFFDLDGFPGYRVELRAGGELLESDDNELAGLIPEGEFMTSVVTFTPESGDTRIGSDLSIRLVSLNQIDPIDPGANLEVDFDDVRLEATPTPPPTSLPGDLNDDCTVNSQDLNTLLADFGCVGGDCAGDADGDGDTDSDDLNAVLAAFGDVCP
jgi:hypothetical protein